MTMIEPRHSESTYADMRELGAAAWFLVCVKGADYGAILPLASPTSSLTSSLTFGRCVGIVSDPQISRHHCEVTWDDTAVRVRQYPSTNGATLHRTLRGIRRPLGLTWTPLRAWDVLAVGSSRWQLRPRPTSMLLPTRTPLRSLTQHVTRLVRGSASRSPETPTRQGGKRGVRGALMFLPLVFIALALTRLAAHLPRMWWAAIALVVGVSVALWAGRRWWRRCTDVWDAGMLTMHLAHCVSQPRVNVGAQMGGRAQIGGRAQSSLTFPWAGAHTLSLWGEGDHPRTPGYYGPHATICALWDIAANSRSAGGGCVVNGADLQVCGNGTQVIHLCSSCECPTCGGMPLPDVAHVAISATRGALPAWCDAVFNAHVAPVSHTWVKQTFHPVDRQDDEGSALPEVVYTADVWRSDTSDGRLACPLGIDEHGQTLSVDIVTDGPHGVIVGSTGSGKSEALMTLLLGLARRYSPQSLRMVLIDYKGGASLGPLEALPHTQTLLTDLCAQQTTRAFEGIRALIDERESLLRNAGYSSISEWEEADPIGAPCRVILACDEFTTFADLHPTLFDDVLRWTAQGRALGIHVLLATQRPDRALAPSILANIDLRVALRCREGGASRTLVGSDAAAELPHIPGRAILEGKGVIQCAWVPDTHSAIRDIESLWHNDEPPSLWLGDLPHWMTTREAAAYRDTANSKSPAGPIIGVVDGIRHGAHHALTWDGGHIRFEGAPHERHHIERATIDCAAAVASLPSSSAPVIVCASHTPPNTNAQHLPLDDHCTLVDYLANTEQSAIVAIPDLPELLSTLDEALGAVHGPGLWNSFTKRCARHGITIVSGTTQPTTQWDKDGHLYAYRFIGTQSPHALAQWSFGARTPNSATPGHFILAAAPPTLPFPLPATTVIPCEAADTSPTTGLCPGGDAGRHILTTPSGTHTSFPATDCLVITDHPEDLPADWHDATCLTPRQWSQIAQHHARTIIACHLNDDIRRVLLNTAHRSDWLLRLKHLPDNNALLIHNGYARHIRLTPHTHS